MVRHVVGRIVLMIATMVAGGAINHFTEARPSWAMYRELSNQFSEAEVRSKARIDRAETELATLQEIAKNGDEVIRNLQKEVLHRDSKLAALRAALRAVVTEAESEAPGLGGHVMR
jgi:uncharacterized coiled-coil DUF342 family protein